MNKNNKQVQLLILLFSIGLHICLLLILFFKQINNPTNKQPPAEKKAKVIFKNPKTKTLKPTFTAGKSHNIPFVKPQKKHVAKKIKPQPIEKNKLQKKTPKQNKESIKKSNIMFKKNKNQFLQNLSTVLNKQKKPFIKQKEKEKKENNFTLADLTKKVLSQAKNNGATKNPYSNHLINIIGKNKGKATAEQLKHERYIAKLFECMKTSFKIFRPSFRFTTIPTTQNLIAALNLNLDTKGKIIDLTLVQSSGCTQYDLFVIKVIKNAGTSFPPLPKYFKTHRYFVPMQFHTPTYALIKKPTQPHMPV